MYQLIRRNMMETVEYLLSQKWENTFLNETFFEALVYLRGGKNLHASNFFRETPIFVAFKTASL